MDKYVVGQIIGEGQFGCVKEAKVKVTGSVVALKFIRMQRVAEGIPHPVARETLIAQRLRCPFLVRTYDVFPCGSSLVVVMERCESDLAVLLRRHAVYNPLPLNECRTLFKMLLTGLASLHAMGILHRDVKPSNCLISGAASSLQSGQVLKLGDFGLSRLVTKDGEMSHEVASRWYRAPELLFGKRRYGEEVDMWSAGCVFGELLRGFGGPLFAGDGDINQLSRIFFVLGTPQEESWPGVSELPDFGKVHFEDGEGCGLDNLVPGATGSARDLLKRLITLDPAKRLTAKEALRHPFFSCQ